MSRRRENGSKALSMMHTTCPSCHAVFRVKPEQLDAHAGKVRCGKCAYVFNGFETLITPIETVSFMAPCDEDDDEDEDIQEKTVKLARPDRPKTESKPRGSGSVEVYDIRPVTIMDALSGSFPLQTDEQITREAEEINRVIAATAHRGSNEADEPPGKKVKSGKSGLEITPELHAKLNNLHQQLSHEQKHARWHFWGWGTGLLVLLLVLAGQSIYFFRNNIAAYYPEAKPWLSASCKVLGCNVEMLAHINFIKLDGVELQVAPDRPNMVTFSASLRNNAAYLQRFPKIELTLTGAANQTLVRRHFTPEEYLPKSMSAEQGLPMLEEIPIKVTLDLQGLEAVGYKSRAFYP